MKYKVPEEARTSIGNLKYLEELRILARNNRKNPTEAEKIFWKRLKKYKYPFLRQKAIYRFILDFYCSKLLLAIEIDGGRDDLLNKIGIKTVRFKNEEVLEKIDEVFIRLEEI